jgi:hypothetical protein
MTPRNPPSWLAIGLSQLIVAVVVSVCFRAGVAPHGRPERGDPAPPTGALDSPDPARLERELHDLRRTVGLLLAREVRKPVSDSPPPPAPLPRASDEETSRAVREDLERRLAAQSPDASSQEEARTLRSTLDGLVAGHGRVAECTCGVEYCKVVLVANDEDQRYALEPQVTAGLKEHEILYVREGTTPAQTTLFIGRSGTRLPIRVPDPS